MRKPSNNPISLPFGSSDPPYSSSDRHTGVDFLPYPDLTVYAPCDAKIILRPNNGKDGNGLYFYAGSDFHGLLHNDHYLVADGQQVKEGQPIAIMGWTGYVVPASPAGTHSHWCIKRNGQFIDPMSVIDKEEDMFEGRTAEDWAIEAKDAQPYKQAVVKSTPWTRGMGMKVDNVQYIIDKLQEAVDNHAANNTDNAQAKLDKIKEIIQ